MELKSKTKMFCGCLNNPDEKHPNINICPICLGHPGTLPTINKKAIEAVLKLGLALNSEIPETSKFDRKNYFYPDLPKGYQISQYDAPLCVGGYLEISDAEDDDALVQSKIKNQKSKIQIKNKKINLRRIHLEEDTARLVHATNDKWPRSTAPFQRKGRGLRGRQATSLVDFNRAGVPLMELVTEPDIKSGKEAVAFARELQLILRYLGISDADMEKGQLRIEANVSLRPEIPNSLPAGDLPKGDKSQIPNKSQIQNFKLGTKVEIKNLNSFRAVEEAIDYEIKRQSEILEKGETVRHETRGWDEFEKKTKSQRLKEEAHDYRYFPEPDLPPLDLTKFNLEELKISIPELPAQKRLRFVKEYNLASNQAEILIEDRILAQYFEEAASELFEETKEESEKGKAISLLFNYLSSDIKGLMNEQKITLKELNITPENFADLIVLISRGEISSRIAKGILKEMFKTGLDPRQIIQEMGLKQISDEETVKKSIEEIIAENLKAVEDYKKGKETALQFLIGKTMAKLKGQGKPEIIEKLLKEALTK
jgi:aspartyl-tRNA(Asn)/glutamyl-tRNA(Gln) amidotransferase subunit B